MAATTTYTTLNGDVILIAGLSNLTSATALNSINQSISIDYLTDSSWDTTGVVNIGSSGGTLAGTFGGANYFAASNKIILIGSAYGTGDTWGGWSMRLLLSDDSYSSAISYTDSDKVLNSSVIITPASMQNFSGTERSYGDVQTAYQVLDISAFDTGNIGVKGIELSNLLPASPDLTYIGVTASPSSIPEPTSVLLCALGATGMLLRRRKH